MKTVEVESRNSVRLASEVVHKEGKKEKETFPPHPLERKRKKGRNNRIRIRIRFACARARVRSTFRSSIAKVSDRVDLPPESSLKTDIA